MSTSPLIEQFYTAFQNRDAKKMTALYHEDIEFEDPAFGKLQGDRARAMWKMLCGNATDLKINFSVLEVDDNGGKARWEAFFIPLARQEGKSTTSSMQHSVLKTGRSLPTRINSTCEDGQHRRWECAVGC